ncbi:restriction endonuclease subunit S [Sulfurospirillum sp. UCH001]|uniref:restriction endonuclease subunit S n=1 Tax=Sulfurospirillum sp. UCH001 TaxID=1581011 RepID=UPI00082FBDA5|nr:restriction endonuclease subunit S [Sulfurospirillum sp. UCH001]
MSHVPKLRFKEFSGEWEERQLIDISQWLSGGTPSKDNPLYWNGNIPWISASSMRGHYFSTSDLMVTNDAIGNGTRQVPENTMLLLVRGSMLYNTIPVGLTTRNVTFNQDVKAISFKEGISSKFMLEWFLHSQNRLLNMVTGTGIGAGKLETSELHSMPILIPSKPEQEKIASFLTSVDTRIELLVRKEELLQQYKKGVMQKIFSQEIRFKADDGSKYPEWEEKKLGEVTKKRSSNISANTLEENNGNYKIYGATGHLKNIDFYTEDTPYISIVKDGAGVGRVLLCDAKSSVLGTLDIIQNNQNMNLYFIYLSLFRIHFEKYIVGSTIPHIYYKDYSSEKIYVPCLKEQTKIANFLSSIDSKIKHIQKQLNATKAFKKALLQQMFV